MAVLKVIEVLGNSKKGWEDAAQQVVTNVSKSVKKIRSVYIQDMQATVKNNKIDQYRINAKVTFEVMDNN